MSANLFPFQLDTHYLEVPFTSNLRRIRVLLPKKYALYPQKRYPVVYFHDGQNVFFDEESYSGHSWRVIETLKENKDLSDMILVGIDNDESNRINEYTPWPITNSPFPEDRYAGGLGDAYSKFLVEVVKSYIDTHYQTKPEKEYTALIGSSLGATITSFVGIAYKEKFERLGIFSLANWITKDSFTKYIEENDINHQQFIYIQVGTQEGDDTDRHFIDGNMKQTYIDGSLEYVTQLIKKGLPVQQIKLNIFADETHTESAWAKHLPEALRFLSQGW